MQISVKQLAGCIACVGTLLVGGGTASAAITGQYSTNFEAPAFTPGSINGQNGWVGYGNGVTFVPGVTIAADPAGSQAVRIPGTSAVSSGDGLKDIGVLRDQNYQTFGTGVVDIQYTSKLSGPAAAGTGEDFDNPSLNLVVYAYPGVTLGNAALSTNGMFYVYGNGTTDAAYAGETAAALGQYHTINAHVDMTAQTIRFSVDGTTVATTTFFNTPSTTYVYPAIDLFSVDDYPGNIADYTGWVDNYSVTATPEPASMTVVAAAGVLLGMRRRRSPKTSN